MTADNTGHIEECKYYETGNFNDCDCKPKEKEPLGHWVKEPFLCLDIKGNIIERDVIPVN